MSVSDSEAGVEQKMVLVRDAVARRELSASAADHISSWLHEPRYAKYRPELERHIRDGLWKTLDDVFWTVIPFGTGGRRGRMYPIGCNAINERTIGESAQGLATYVKKQRPGPYSCAIAYDTRHRSDEFATLCAEIMAAAGFLVYLLRPFRSTPELSFAIRHFQATCGIMVTASHNPPSDNAVKVYWSTGGQLLPPHDTGVIDEVQNVQEIRRVDFAQAHSDGRIREVTEEADREFIRNVVAQGFAGPREVAIVYSPLHGVGGTAVLPALKGDGFQSVRVFPPHAEPNGDFPNVPGHVANPENTQVFDAIIEFAKDQQADLILATDPDADRLGCAAPKTLDMRGPWGTFTGNQIGALSADYVLSARRRIGSLSPRHYVVKTLVTTDLIARIAEHYGVQMVGDLHVGFKWIGGVMDEQGPDQFVYGTEESHGYLVGQYARDKDGAVAAMLMAELVARCRADGQSLHQKLDALYWQFGYHAETLINVQMPGSEGMSKMKRLMHRIRQSPPEQLGGHRVARLRDYETLQCRFPGGQQETLVGPRGDLVILDFTTPGNRVALRPSGTEPKIKFYLFACEVPEQIADLETTKQAIGESLKGLEQALRGWCEADL